VVPADVSVVLLLGVDHLGLFIVPGAGGPQMLLRKIASTRSRSVGWSSASCSPGSSPGVL
jgi:hypothetical protein